MSAESTSGLSRAALATVMAVAAAAFVPAAANAQGLFSALFGGFSHNDRESDWGGRRDWGRRGLDDSYGRGPTAYAPSTSNLDGRRFPAPDFAPRLERRSAEAAAPRNSGVHCVRLCDGRYFPLPRSANGARLDPMKVCSALCPAAKTQVFHGGNMEHAVAADGTRYADLDEAFAFRDKIVPDCSCTGHGPGGLAQIDIESDPTLRAGDVVVSAAGPTVFRGSSQFPYRSSDFTPVGDYARLNAQLRQKLAELKVNHTVTPVVPPQKLTASNGKEARSARPRRRARSAEASSARAYQPRPQFQAWWR